MAKKKKQDDNDEVMMENEGEKSGNGFVTALTIIIIVAIWLVIFGILIKTDFMGFGSSVLTPVLEDVPVINRILPNYSSTNDNNIGSVTGINDDMYDSLEEANAQIRKLQEQLLDKTETVEDNKQTISTQKKEISRLKKYRDAFEDFDDLKKAFDNEVVFGESALPYEEYMKFYQEIEPENAEEIYRQCVEQQQGDAKIQAQATRFAAMDPTNAAAILGNMTGDLDVVCQILGNMKEAEAAEILAAMDTNFASKITKKMTVSD